MDAHESPVPLREALLFLAVAGLLIPLLQRARVNPVFGFLAAGALLGPHGLGGAGERVPSWIAAAGFRDRGAVEIPAQLGLLFLMFSIGLELSLERLWSMRRWVFGVGGAQLAATAAAVAGIAWLVLDLPVPSATVVGFVLAFSSTAVALQLLAERDRLGTPAGRASFAVLLMQDLAVVPLLLLVGVLGGQAGGDGGRGLFAEVGLALGKGALAIGVLFVLGRRLLQPAFRRLIVPGRPDTFVALTLLASLGIAAATGAVGMSPALGALLAGLLLAETEFRHEIEATLEPFKGLLMGLFFMSVGMGLDLAAAWHAPLALLGATLALFAVKAAVLAPILRIGGLPAALSIECGLLLGQAGEFGFVMLGVALASGVVSPELERSVALLIGASLFATPLAAALGRRLGAVLERRSGPAAASASASASGGAAATDGASSVDAGPRPAGDGGPDARADARPDAGPGAEAIPDDLAGPVEPPPVEGRIVVAGYGRVGGLVGDVLHRHRVDWMALETDPRAIASDRESGRPVVYGDATRPELLRRLGIDRAAALVVTVHRLSTAIATIEVARRVAPGLRIIARARDAREARRLREAGADAVIPETLECGLRLAEGALAALGLPDEHVDRIVAQERDRRIGPLVAR